MQQSPLALQHRLIPEDQARADCYALLAALFGHAPDARLLHMIGSAPRLSESADQPFAVAYNLLLDASAAMDAEAARQEYDDLFIGVGKSEVDPHAAHWRSEPGSSRSLAELRSDLGRLGLGRTPQTSLYEDHVAALCETMRMMISGRDDWRPLPTSQQRVFFERHLSSWIDVFCNAICVCPLANYYRRVAELMRTFMAIERESLAMD